MEETKRGRGRPRQYTAEERMGAQRNAKKKYSQSHIALSTGSFLEWEKHRVMCGFVSHVTFAQHLLTLHEGHCPMFIALGHGSLRDQGDKGQCDDRQTSPLIKSLDLADMQHLKIGQQHLTSPLVTSTQEAFDAVSEPVSGSESEQVDGVFKKCQALPKSSISLTLVDDLADRWCHLQELAGYQEADLQFLCWLLELAGQMLRPKKNGRSQQPDRKSKKQCSRGRRSLRLKGNRVWYREQEEDEDEVYGDEERVVPEPSMLQSHPEDVTVKEEIETEEEDEREEEEQEEEFVRESVGEEFVCRLCGYTTVHQEELDDHLSEYHSEPRYTPQETSPQHQTTNSEPLSEQPPVKRKRGRPPNSAQKGTQNPNRRKSPDPKSKPELKTTRKRGRPPSQKPKVTFTCDDCKEQFPHEYSYKLHRHKWHSEEEPIRNYTCETCGKTYGTLPSLASHQKTHTQIRPRCPICNKETANNQNLRKHVEVVHQQIRKHCCEVCGRLFTQAQHLLHHKRTVHLGTHKVPCTWPNCGKVFNKKHNLTIHMRIHLDEKPLRCDYCDFRCRQRNSMTWHMKKHHGVKRDSSGHKTNSGHIAPPTQTATGPLDRTEGGPTSESNASTSSAPHSFDHPNLSPPQPRTTLYDPQESTYPYQLPSVSQGAHKTTSLTSEVPSLYRRPSNSNPEETNAHHCLYQSMPVFPPQPFSYMKQETCVPYPRSTDDPLNSSR